MPTNNAHLIKWVLTSNILHFTAGQVNEIKTASFTGTLTNIMNEDSPLNDYLL